MAEHRFFVPTSFDVAKVEVSGKEAHHLIHVLRAQIGDSVGLFDGQGNIATAEIVAITKRKADLRIESSQTAPSEPGSPIVLAAAIPKGDRFRWLVEKLTELGVARLIPLRTNHSLIDPREGKFKRMRQTVIEACKQCGRSRLMQIDAATDWQQLVQREFPQRAVFVAHPGAMPPRIECLRRSDDADTDVVLAVGPEGGFSEEEIKVAVDAGANLIGLGPAPLRIETAAVALAAIFRLTKVFEN